MRRLAPWILALSCAVAAPGCGNKDPPAPPPLTPEEERAHEQELKAARQAEGKAERGRQPARPDDD